MTEPSVAPTWLLRVGALPASSLDRVAAPEVGRATAASDELDRVAADAGQVLANLLFALVPLTTEPNDRRDVLGLKRDAHNRRWTPAGQARASRVARHAPPEITAAITAWTRAQEELDHAEAAGARTVEMARREGRRSLIGHLRGPAILDGLALASPDFTAELMAADPSAPSDRLARSALAYLIRTAAKASPFSTLTLVRVGGGEADGAGGAAPLRRRTILARSIAGELLAAFAHDVRLAGCLRYRPAPTSGRSAVVNRLSSAGGVFVGQESCIDVAMYDDTLARLHTAGRALTLSEVTASLGPDATQARVSRFVAMGLLLPEAPWAPDDECPLRALADGAGSIEDPTCAALAERLRLISAELEALPTGQPADRIRVLRSTRRALTTAFTDLGASTPAWLGRAPLVYEDAIGPDVGPLPPELIDDLATVADLLAPTVARSHLHDLLVEHFQRETGGDDRPVRALDLVAGLASRDDLAELTGSRRGEHGVLAREPGPSSLPAIATVAFQVHAESGSVADGDHLSVVNQVGSFTSGMFQRYHRGAGAAGARRLGAWVQALLPDTRILELPVGAQRSSLQFCGVGLFPPAGWSPDASAHRGTVLDAAELLVRYEPDQDTLSLVDRAGAPVLLLYPGLPPDVLLTGPVRLLLALSDPWVIGPLGSPPVSSDAAVVHLPRRCHGRVVVERESWRVAPDVLPLRRPGESDWALLRRARRWQEEHGLPDEAFARVDHRGRFEPSSRLRKPVWFCWSNVDALDHVATIVRPGSACVLTEVLPTRQGHWIGPGAVGGEHHVAEIVAAMTVGGSV